MLKHCYLLRSLGSAPFTAELCNLIHKTQQLPCCSEVKISGDLSSVSAGIHGTSFELNQTQKMESRKDVFSGGARENEIWIQLELLSAKAHALKETDTVYSLFQNLIKKGYYPPSLDSWILFAHHFLPFSDVESMTVLQYPGYKRDPNGGSSQIGTVPTADLAKYTLRGGRGFSLSRQTLLLTGGVVPLMNRKPASDGNILSLFIHDFYGYATIEKRRCASLISSSFGQEERKYGEEIDLPVKRLGSAVGKMLNLIASYVQKNQQTVKFSLIAAPIAQLIKLFWDLSLLRLIGAGSATNEFHSSMSSEIQKQFSSLVHLFLSVNEEGLGPAIALHFFSTGLSFEDWVGESKVWGGSRRCNEGENNMINNDISFFVRMQLDALVDTLEAVKLAQDDMKVDFLWMMRRVDDLLVRILQHNANHRNILQISTTMDQKCRILAAEVLLAAMRREALFPDQFLRDAMEIIERCAPSMFMEAVLLSAKAQLLEVFDLDKEKQVAVYKDLINSLRNLVDLRPKQQGTTNMNFSEGGEYNNEMIDEEWKEHASCKLDAYSQKILQRAHEEAITVLCASDDLEYLNEAYSIIISHKYHSLIVTKEVIKPLLRAFARRGDGRAFNLVDLCVLYSNQTVDMDVFSCLFHVCAVNGDHYRARTMLKLLEETIPGFLLKAPESIKQDLQYLKVLPYEPAHLFMSEEDIQISEAMGRKLDKLRPLPH